MAESYEHKYLVLKSQEWIFSNLIKEEDCFVFVDIDRKLKFERPIVTLNGYQPDLVCKGFKNFELVILEAKTKNDIDNIHSINQFKSYFRTCELNIGQSYFVIAVPFTYGARVKTVLRNIGLVSTLKTSIIVLEL